MFGCGVPVPSAHRPQGEPQYLSVHRGFPHQPVTVHERHVHPARIGRNGDHHRTGSASVGPLLRECAGKSKCGPKSLALAVTAHARVTNMEDLTAETSERAANI